MLLGIIFAMFVCIIFNIPVLPVLIGGAAGIGGMAYFLTRDKSLLKLLAALFVVAGSHFVIGSLLLEMPGATTHFPPWVIAIAQSEGLVGFSAVIVILISCIIGIFGPLRHTPDDMPGVLRMIHDAETKLRGRSK